MNYANFNILPELEKCLPPLTPEKLETLKQSIIESGVKCPLLVCSINGMNGYYLLDGHNRYRIAHSLGIAYVVDPDNPPEEFDSIDDAKEWIIEFQFGRRDLTPLQREYHLGMRLDQQKKPRGGKHQNEDNVKTAQLIGKQSGLSSATIERRAAKARLINQLGLSEAVNSGSIVKIEVDALKELAEEIDKNPTNKDLIITKALSRSRENNGIMKPVKKSKKLVKPKATTVQEKNSTAAHTDEIPTSEIEAEIENESHCESRIESETGNCDNQDTDSFLDCVENQAPFSHTQVEPSNPEIATEQPKDPVETILDQLRENKDKLDSISNENKQVERKTLRSPKIEASFIEDQSISEYEVNFKLSGRLKVKGISSDGLDKILNNHDSWQFAEKLSKCLSIESINNFNSVIH